LRRVKKLQKAAGKEIRGFPAFCRFSVDNFVGIVRACAGGKAFGDTAAGLFDLQPLRLLFIKQELAWGLQHL